MSDHTRKTAGRVIGKPAQKKRYGVVSVSSAELGASRAEEGNEGRSGNSAAAAPLLKIDGINAKFLTPEFVLPDVRGCEEQSIEVAHRILGFPITEKLLNHLPDGVTSDLIGQLIECYPFAFHRRFGKTYSDRVCPLSTKTSKCPVCDGRRDLFNSAEYERGLLTKSDIMSANFGTRNIALFFAMTYFNGEVIGPHPIVTNLTNPFAKMKRNDNFFDLVGDLTKTKTTTSIRRNEALPEDYYSNGDGARWLIAEYKRAIYESSEDRGSGFGTAPRRSGGPYWKLASVTPMKTIEGIGDAADVWWPEIDVGGTVDDALEFIDVIGLINHTDFDTLKSVAEDSKAWLLRKVSKNDTADTTDAGDAESNDGGDNVQQGNTQQGNTQQGNTQQGNTQQGTDYCWQDIMSAKPEDLLDIVEDYDGDIDHANALLNDDDVPALRRYAAKLLGVRPTRATRGDQNDGMPF